MVKTLLAHFRLGQRVFLAVSLQSSSQNTNSNSSTRQPSQRTYPCQLITTSCRKPQLKVTNRGRLPHQRKVLSLSCGKSSTVLSRAENRVELMRWRANSTKPHQKSQHRLFLPSNMYGK